MRRADSIALVPPVRVVRSVVFYISLHKMGDLSMRLYDCITHLSPLVTAN